MLVKSITYCFNRNEAEETKNSLFIFIFGVSVVGEEQSGHT